MDIRIRYHHMPTAQDLSEYVEYRLSHSLDRFAGRIRRIVMHLYDMNGPRGGVDKKCLAVVDFNVGGNVAIEVRDANSFSAVDRVSDRLKERLHRELGRRRWKRSLKRTLLTGGNDGQ